MSVASRVGFLILDLEVLLGTIPDEVENDTYISCAVHSRSLESLAVQLFHCGFEVGSGLELHEPLQRVSGLDRVEVEGYGYPLPSRSRPVSE